MTRALCLLGILLAATFLTGCKVGVPPDPNSPPPGTAMRGAELRRNLKGASDMLNERVSSGEIDEAKAAELLQSYAEELAQTLDLGKVPPDEAWEYAEVYLTARKWAEAEQVLKLAVKSANSEDRRVNDTLRLARAQANQGRVEEAIATARTVFDAPPRETAPILPAVLFEIAPVARGKGHDLELAKLIEDAIKLHERTIVDPETEAGRMFMYARPSHIRNAWLLIEKLYEDAGRPDQARNARERQFSGYADSRFL